MASSSLTSIPFSYSFLPNSPGYCYKPLSCNITSSSPFCTFSHTVLKPHRRRTVSVKAENLDFSGSFFEDDEFGSDSDPPELLFPALEEKEEPPCPPGLRQYETMTILRPDMVEDERLALTQKYEELLVAGGGMYVEVFNRGIIPLAYSIKTKNRAGETNTYLDGIYLLFTYFTKPGSVNNLEETLKADDDVIRSMTSKVRKRKY